MVSYPKGSCPTQHRFPLNPAHRCAAFHQWAQRRSVGRSHNIPPSAGQHNCAPAASYEIMRAVMIPIRAAELSHFFRAQRANDEWISEPAQLDALTKTNRSRLPTLATLLATFTIDRGWDAPAITAPSASCQLCPSSPARIVHPSRPMRRPFGRSKSPA